MSSETGAARAKPASIVEIEEWVSQNYGFVPHPYWIDHCRELYLGSARSSEGHTPWHECPQDKREAIRNAFIHFGLLSE
jgi:hypothetical protein